jgi:hypothetical protein
MTLPNPKGSIPGKIPRSITNYTSLVDNLRSSPDNVTYTDDVEHEEYGDMGGGPRNMGHIRPNEHEWGDYIQEEQESYLSDVASGARQLPKVKERDSRKMSSLGNIRSKGAKEKPSHLSEQFGD